MSSLTGQPEPSDVPSLHELLVARRVLLAVVAGFVLLQYLLFSFDRAPRWDEAVYLSQVSPGMPAQFFAPFRARGVSLLIAPITWWGGSIHVVRVYLSAASALAFGGAFWVWVPSVGIAAPLAAALYGFSWIGLLNGSEIYPNFLAATVGVAIVGCVCRHLREEGRWPLAIASVLMAVLGLLRPTDATAVFGALGVYVIVWRRSSWRLLLPLGLGLGIGWLPWILEMSIRFGGPIAALDEAGSVPFALRTIAENVRQYVAYGTEWASGPEGVRIALPSVLWWGWLIAMAVVGVTQRRVAAARGPAIASAVAAVALAFGYTVLLQDRALAPRYLLPTLGFVAIPAGVGAVSLIRGSASARAIGVAALSLLVPWVIWQGTVADRVEAQEARYRGGFRTVGRDLERLAGGRPCSFSSPRGTAMIAWASGCEGTQLTGPVPTLEELQDLAPTGTSFAILPRKARRDSPLSGLTYVLSDASGRTWYIYRLPPSG